MSLTSSQVQDFQRDGYLFLPGAIAAELVENAVQTINYKVGQGVPTDQLQTWRSQSFFPELRNQNVVLDLFNASGLRENLQELMGAENVAAANWGQLALRFPLAPGTGVQPPRWHIDGIHSPDNGVPPGEIHSFSALVGVFLTDVAANDAGNFTVWPGSHIQMQDYFREHGLNEILRENKIPKIDKNEALQIQAKAGDAVIAHYQLLHGVAGNHAPNPRYATFFRVKHPEHETHKLKCLTDLWREWPGVRAGNAR